LVCLECPELIGLRVRALYGWLRVRSFAEFLEAAYKVNLRKVQYLALLEQRHLVHV
jgi:hypothetical protein